MSGNIWPAVSGAIAQERSLETLSNNLANVDTAGFKKDLPVFKEYLAAEERTQEISAPAGRKRITDKDLAPLGARDQAYVVAQEIRTEFSPGNMKVTSRPLDVALEGPGFFEVSTPNGMRLTKQGRFRVGPEGMLVTTDGHPVLKAQVGAARMSVPGGVPQGMDRVIRIDPTKPNISINERGEVFQDEDSIGQLAVVEKSDLNQLRKMGGLLFEDRNPEDRKPVADATRVRQGMIETSNVNPIEEMTNLIRANRMFEQGMRSIRVYSDLQQKEATEIGKL